MPATQVSICGVFTRLSQDSKMFIQLFVVSLSYIRGGSSLTEWYLNTCWWRSEWNISDEYASVRILLWQNFILFLYRENLIIKYLPSSIIRFLERYKYLCGRKLQRPRLKYGNVSNLAKFTVAEEVLHTVEWSHEICLVACWKWLTPSSRPSWGPPSYIMTGTWNFASKK